MIQAKDGALYGTTPFGGSVSLGSVFKLKNDGKDFQVIHSFAASPGEARGPHAALLQATDGALYGTTTEGGDANQGAIFRIRMP